MAAIDDVRALLGEALQLGDRAQTLTADTALLGNLPEFDSMAVATVITAVEERFDVVVEDEDLNAEVFRTVGSLANFVEKLRAG